jgi:hypothetical protein
MTSRPSPDPDDLSFSVLPPNDLLSEWEDDIIYVRENIDITLLKAYQAGADAELEACCEWFKEEGWNSCHPEALRASRRPRPKPPSLKEQAQAELKRLIALIPTEGAIAMAEPIRRALEALPDD